MSTPLDNIRDSIGKIDGDNDSTTIDPLKIASKIVGDDKVKEIVEKIPEPVTKKIGKIQIPSVFGQSILKSHEPTANNSTANVGLEAKPAEVKEGCIN